LLSACAVIPVEIATADERNAHRIQVTVTDAGHLDADARRSYARVRLERDRPSAVPAVQRQAIRYCGRCDAARLGKIVPEASDSEIDVPGSSTFRTGVKLQRRCVQ